MRSFLRTLAIVSAVTLFATIDNPSQAQRRCRHSQVPAHTPAPHAGHVYLVPAPSHGGYAMPSPKSAYAYGWFGVSKRRHKGVHYGYYNHRTDWTFR